MFHVCIMWKGFNLRLYSTSYYVHAHFGRTVCLLFPSSSDSPFFPRSRSISFSLSVSLPLLPLPPPFPHMLLLQVNFLLFLSLRSEKTDTLALLIPIKAGFLLTG